MREASSSGPLSGIASNFSRVATDAIELAELQVALLQRDGRRVARRLVLPVTFFLLAGGLLVAALPVMYLGLSGSIASLSGLPDWAAQLTVGGVGLLLGVLVALVSVMRATKAIGSIQPTLCELRNNVDWLKSVFQSDQANCDKN